MLEIAIKLLSTKKKFTPNCNLSTKLHHVNRKAGKKALFMNLNFYTI